MTRSIIAKGRASDCCASTFLKSAPSGLVRRAGFLVDDVSGAADKCTFI
jgi:hypothetical protein